MKLNARETLKVVGILESGAHETMSKPRSSQLPDENQQHLWRSFNEMCLLSVTLCTANTYRFAVVDITK